VGLDRLAVERLMRVGIVFPGQGSQAVGMGGALVEHSPEAADLFRRAERVLGYDLLATIRNGSEDELRATRVSQPAIFVTNYALALAACADVRPVASAGHSFAEFCSLTLAGSLAFEDALALVRERGLAMQEAAELAPGAMAAILGLGADAVREVTTQARNAGRVRLANFNAPTQIVISGDRSAVELASELAVAAGARKAIPLNVSGAWHSELMEPARSRFARSIAQAPFALPAFTVVSNVDAEPYRDVATIRTNLIRSVTDEVLWHATAERLLEERLDFVLECGGSAVLTALVRRLPGAPKTLHVGDEAGLAKLVELVSSGAAVS
jgi:[acyl-carrier-protein] S-malonyltransferase